MDKNYIDTTGVMKTVRSVFTLLFHTIYLSHHTQVAGENIFRKYMVDKAIEDRY